MRNKGTRTSRANAAAWSAPGGGYEQWRKGDVAREKALPVGGVAAVRKVGRKRARKRSSK